MRRRVRQSRRGNMLVLLAFLIVMFTAIASLAVDYGHVQLVKTQMQRTADAVARGYIEYYLTNGQSYANSHGPALYSAANNPIDANSGYSPTITVPWGYWTSTSGTFSTSSGTVPAVEITITRTATAGNPMPLIWGGIIGIPTVDLHVTSIACANPTSLPFVGLTGVTIGGSALINSYLSSSGIYSSQSASESATVESNGDITLSQEATVEGNATPGIGCTTTTSQNATVTGSISPLKTILSYPAPTMPTSYTDYGTINYTASGTMSVAAGTYYCTGLTVGGSGTFLITGPVIFYVNGPINISGNVEVAENLPQNLVINVLSNNSVILGASTEFDAYVYAPLSAVTVSGSFAGGIISNSLSATGGNLHNDLSGGGTPSVSLVQ